MSSAKGGSAAGTPAVLSEAWLMQLEKLQESALEHCKMKQEGLFASLLNGEGTMDFHKSPGPSSPNVLSIFFSLLSRLTSEWKSRGNAWNFPFLLDIFFDGLFPVKIVSSLFLADLIFFSCQGLSH